MSAEVEYDESKMWSDAERQAYLDKIPEMSLFDDHIIEGDVMVDAMVALVEEGETAETLALSFKNKGNKHYSDARKFNKNYYTYAIEEYTKAVGYGQKALADPTDPELLQKYNLDEPIVLSQLMAAIFNNRAACHLALKNYGSCRSDAARALKHEPTNIKAIYRGAKASSMLKKPEDTLRYCKVGLAIDPTNKELLALEASGKVMLEDQRVEAELEAFKHQKRRAMTTKYKQLCALRKVRVGPAVLTDRRVADFCGKADLSSTTGAMEWPVLFLYDEYGQSDFIQQFDENDLVIEHLANMFPEDGPFCMWDTRQDYKASQLVVYAVADIVVPFQTDEEWHVTLSGEPESDEAEAKRLRNDELNSYKQKWWLEVTPFCSLAMLLTHHQYVVPGIPVLNIMVRGSKHHEQFLDAIERRVVRIEASLPPMYS
ncbi:unnamed protein product [Aphanomyces euteiches]|uniref:Cns1/TTC4 wheel domain-containing protein n=1 Tax=Aphanomyces euteiches TaxID=100861 RepID=A0A6G0XI66_9STRA|nr:hypothetical protein Ae201684_004477 [Aphanomyces euteiches]KAH9093960.1 hypothetical protein Ae201684P_016579 [Aphanomyces euteiches]KAH9103438.1 hypothetical protein AeMF1_020218 [Aphanomyces euteiches]KAH9121082.1 hypothetical protein LEN26_010823 [Aphanomyces euteiches]KAH9193892.1 hypothetical protein AeNC1_004131 [Aphanomyces euteiches]